MSSGSSLAQTHTHTHLLSFPPPLLPLPSLPPPSLPPPSLPRSNIDEGMRLYKRSVELTLSKTELSQCVTAHLMSEMQIRVCTKLGLDMHEVMQKAENSMRRNLGMFP